jgi:hypothetical protein
MVEERNAKVETGVIQLVF